MIPSVWSRALAVLLLVGGSVCAQSLGVLQPNPGSPGFGNGLAGGADMDGDGVPDIAVGDPSDLFGAGRVTIFSGLTLAPLRVVNGGPGPGGLGTGMAMADVNSDGFADVLMGERDLSRAQLLLGGPTLAFGATIAFSAPLASFGQSITTGDLDGDGFRDIIIGSQQGSTAPGSAVIFWGPSFGASLTFSNLPGLQTNGDTFGAAVEVIGDVNGDGRDDLAVGSPHRFLAPPAIGRVDVFGFPGRVQTALGGRSPGAAVAPNYGLYISRLGNVSGTGVPEFVVTNGGTACEVVNGSAIGGGAFLSLVGTGPVFDGGVDFDGDGKLDFITGNAVRSGQNGAILALNSAAGAGCAGAFLGDINQDCRQDWGSCGFATTGAPSKAVYLQSRLALSITGGNCTGILNFALLGCPADDYVIVFGPATPGAPANGWFFGVHLSYDTLAFCLSTPPFTGVFPPSGGVGFSLLYPTAPPLSLCGTVFDVVGVRFPSALPFVPAPSNVVRIVL